MIAAFHFADVMTVRQMTSELKRCNGLYGSFDSRLTLGWLPLLPVGHLRQTYLHLQCRVYTVDHNRYTLLLAVDDSG